MADFVFNPAKGRIAELFRQMKAGDTPNARIWVIPVDVGLMEDGELSDTADLETYLALGPTLPAGSDAPDGWYRLVFAPADLPDAPVVNVDADYNGVSLAAMSWTGVLDSNPPVSDLIVAWSAVTAPTAAQMQVLTQHDFVVTPDGNDIVAVSDEFYRAF